MFLEVKHPLIEHKIGHLRNKQTSYQQFRMLTDEIAMLLAYEATKNIQTQEIEIETPLEKTMVKNIQSDIILLPILRAGLGMVDGILRLIPNARVGHIGIYRNEETLEPNFYFFKIPKNKDGCQVILLDPMLATGGSAVYAIEKLKDLHIKGETKILQISLICLVASPRGIKKVEETHPDVYIYCASLDRELNAKGYILPGLGDAGDRIFGTQ